MTMVTIRTIVTPRSKALGGKKADIMTFNMERLEYQPGTNKITGRRLEGITVTPQGVEVTESDASFITSVSRRVQRIKMTDGDAPVKDINYSRMNKDGLLAAATLQGHDVNPKMTNAVLRNLIASVRNMIVGGPPEVEDDPDSDADPPKTDEEE